MALRYFTPQKSGLRYALEITLVMLWPYIKQVQTMLY